MSKVTYPHYIALYYKYNDTTKYRLPRRYKTQDAAARGLHNLKSKGVARITFTYRVDSPEDTEHKDAKTQ